MARLGSILSIIALTALTTVALGQEGPGPMRGGPGAWGGGGGGWGMAGPGGAGGGPAWFMAGPGGAGGGQLMGPAGRPKMAKAERMFKAKIPNGVDRELKKLHYDVALAANKPALAALFTYVPVSQVLLGSDYPFGTSTDGIAGLDAFGLTQGDLAAIHRGNAERLIPRLKG